MTAPAFTRELGRTGVPVSRLGLGLAALGRPGYLNLGHGADLAANLGRRADVHALRDHTHGVLDAALAAGVRYFDTARSYGLAEQFLRTWLDARGLGPAEVSVGSKWGYTYTADWRADAAEHEVKEHSLANFERQWPESRAELGPWLRVYMVHSVTPDSPALHDAALVARLARLADEGVTVGLSVSGPAQAETLRRALNLRVDGREVFSVVQATWNLLEPSAGPALAEAHERGWGVIVKEAVANGRLTRPDRESALSDLSARYGVTPDVIALAGVLAQPFADVVLSGATTTAHLASNTEALGLHLTRDDLARLTELREDAAAYWSLRSRLPWT